MSSAWFSGVAASILTPIIVGWAANRTRDVSASRDGWHRVRPSGGLFGMIIFCGGFALLLFYIFFFVGSARADAEKQMRILLGLASTFSAATIWSTWLTFKDGVEWQGKTIRVRPLVGSTSTLPIDSLRTIDFSSFQSMFLLRFRDGRVVKLSPYMHGTRQLLQHIDRVAPAALPEPYYAPDEDDD